MAIDDLEQIPMKAGLIRAEPLHQIRDIEDGATLACEVVNGQACAGRQFLAERVLNERIFFAHGDPRAETGRRTDEACIPAPAGLQALSGNELH